MNRLAVKPCSARRCNVATMFLGSLMNCLAVMNFCQAARVCLARFCDFVQFERILIGEESRAQCAWRYAATARRSESSEHLAARVPRQAICTAAAWDFGFVFVIYKMSSGALKV
ncbi:hypothetical protein DEO72_LG3g607 [Vigna unguiculata]|uniref:Secreted protein n=1 Tax=Vigna unguiculata TaxID=3917 RepID=A0A4D6LCF4_VIGUN|nr:hypothetical protein DEO72_LG3g607 [Vigna unguiculata]